jgi:hypothetical protein
MKIHPGHLFLIGLFSLATGCKGNSASPEATSTTTAVPSATSTPSDNTSSTTSSNLNNCADLEGVNGTFAVVTEPLAGTQVQSVFSVKGCSIGPQGTVDWRLVDVNGRVVNEGISSGGNTNVGSNPEPFEFTVSYSVFQQQIGYLYVRTEDPTDQRLPTGTVLPLTLTSNSSTDTRIQSLSDGDYYFSSVNNLETDQENRTNGTSELIIFRKEGNTAIGWAAGEGVECFRWTIKSNSEVESTEFYPDTQEIGETTTGSGSITEFYPDIQYQFDIREFSNGNAEEILQGCITNFS